MEAPPYYSGAPKKSNTGLIIGGIVAALALCCCGVCGYGGFMVKGIADKSFGMLGCSQAMAQQRDGLVKYAAKHDDQLPAAANWQDDIKPYVTETPKGEGQPFAVPTASDTFCDKGGGTSISLNTAVAGKKLASIKDPSDTIALFETPGTGRNKASAFEEQPFTTSPKVVMDERRGWMRQTLKGQVETKDKNGEVTPMSQFKVRRRRGVTITPGTTTSTTTTTGD